MLFYSWKRQHGVTSEFVVQLFLPSLLNFKKRIERRKTKVERGSEGRRKKRKGEWDKIFP